jgi:hypothetical protein
LPGLGGDLAQRGFGQLQMQVQENVGRKDL